MGAQQFQIQAPHRVLWAVPTLRLDENCRVGIAHRFSNCFPQDNFRIGNCGLGANSGETVQHPARLTIGLVSAVAMNIGQKVRIRRLRDRVSQGVIQKLGQIGVVQDFKMTDGSGVGVLVQFEDKFSTWFFEDEVEVAA